MKRHKLTAIGLILAVALYLLSVGFDFDLHERMLTLFDEFEAAEIDELIIPLTVFLGFCAADMFRRYSRLKLDLERAKIYEAMLSSTHHILNNFLNQMQLFRMTAEGVEGFPAEVLKLYDQIMAEATSQVAALGNVASVDPSSIRLSVAPRAEVARRSGP